MGNRLSRAAGSMFRRWKATAYPPTIASVLAGRQRTGAGGGHPGQPGAVPPPHQSGHRAEPFNIDDADMFIGECANGAIYSMQSSYVTVGNYPGIEARIYGSEGARSPGSFTSFGQIQTRACSQTGRLEFVQLEIPSVSSPGYRPDLPGHRLLRQPGAQLPADRCWRRTNQGNFAQSAACAGDHQTRWCSPLSRAALGRSAAAGKYSPSVQPAHGKLIKL